MSNGVHEFEDDPRNATALVWMNGALVPRGEARVSVLDAGFVFGDGVWEGLRLQEGRFLFLDAHLDRLWEGLRTLMIDPGLDRAALVRALHETVDANGMTDGVHLRLMVTRGVKRTPYQDPRVTIGPATIVILPEHKVPRPDVVARGVTLATVHVRRGYPDVQDPKLNSHSKLNCITACIQGAQAGADEALMLDPHGFVATCNSTHFFVVRKGEVWTSTGRFCLPGITRAAVLRTCREAGMVALERDFSLTEVYGADEAFVTGTFAGVVHVRSVDGRGYAEGAGPVVRRIRELYRALCAREPGRP